MATYTELYGLHNDSALKNRVSVACIVAAEVVMNEDPVTTNHANRLLWAAAVLASPQAEATRMYWALLAANKDMTVENIQAATDAQIQIQTEAHINLFATEVILEV